MNLFETFVPFGSWVTGLSEWRKVANCERPLILPTLYKLLLPAFFAAAQRALAAIEILRRAAADNLRPLLFRLPFLPAAFGADRSVRPSRAKSALSIRLSSSLSASTIPSIPTMAGIIN